MRRILAAALAASVMVTAALVGIAGPASAVSRNGCPYPRVCFYPVAADFNAGRYSAAYKDVTTSAQSLSLAALGADYVVNTRNDDRVLLWYWDFGTRTNNLVCLSPNNVHVFKFWHEVTDVLIETAPNC